MNFNKILKSLFGDKSSRDMKLIQPLVEQVKAVYPEVQKLDNDALRARTKTLQQQVQNSANEQKKRIEELKATIENTPIDERADIFAQIDKIEKEVLEIYEGALNEVMPEVFAIVKETARRFAENEETIVTANDFDHANNTLEYVETFIDTIAGVIGRVSLIYNAIIFAYNNVDFNKNRLQPAFEKYSDRIGNIATMEDALNAVSTVYNYRYLGTKLYLSTDYSRFQDEKNLRKRKKEGRRTRTNI